MQPAHSCSILAPLVEAAFVSGRVVLAFGQVGRTQPFLKGALSKHKQTHDEVTVRFADPHVLFMIIATSSGEE